MKRYVVVLALVALTIVGPSASAADCGSNVISGSGGLLAGTKCTTDDQATSGGAATTVSDNKSPYLEYEWRWPCTNAAPGGGASLDDCGAAMVCDVPTDRRWDLFGRLAGEGWVLIRSQCFGARPPAFVPPTVTPGMVLAALRRVGLPSLEVEVQPAGRTLVNFDTIFHTDPRPVDVDLTILGQAVRVQATPTTYVWSFGDGTSLTTSIPGAPYPSRDVTHRYADAGTTVSPSVTVVYGARFRVGGGAWQDVNGTVSIPGPAQGLEVVEAAPALAGEGG